MVTQCYSLQKDFIVNCDGLLSGFAPIIRDSWESFETSDLPEYFKKGYAILTKRLEWFRSLERPLTAREERELKFMLEALISAKDGIYGNDNLANSSYDNRD